MKTAKLLISPKLTSKGFTLVDSLISGAILAIVSVVVLSIMMMSFKFKNKANHIDLMLAVQDKFIEAAFNSANYLSVDIKLKDPKANAGGVLPTIPLKINFKLATDIDYNLAPFPNTPNIIYLDDGFNVVTSTGNWSVGIAAQYKMYFKNPAKNMTNYIYGVDLFDYRIAMRVFPNRTKLTSPLRNLSAMGMPEDAFNDLDFSWIISKNFYSRNANSNSEDFYNSCTNNLISGTYYGALVGLAGIDKEKSQVYCIFANTEDDCGDPQVNYLRSGKIFSKSYGYQVSYGSNCVTKARHKCPGNNYKVQSFDTKCYFNDGQCDSVSSKGTCVVKYPHEVACTNINSSCGKTIESSGPHKVCPKYYAPKGGGLCGAIPVASKKIKMMPYPCTKTVPIPCAADPTTTCYETVPDTCLYDACESDTSSPLCYSGCSANKNEIVVTKTPESTCWSCSGKTLMVNTFQCEWDDSQGKKEVDEIE